MKSIFEWLFKPYECQYESNWATQCYNRMWYITAFVDNPLTLTIAMLVLAFTTRQPSVVFWVVGFAFGMMLFNFVQLGLSESHWKKHCEKLYQKLMRGE